MIDWDAPRPRLTYWLVELPAEITRVWQRIYTVLLIVGCIAVWMAVLMVSLVWALGP